MVFLILANRFPDQFINAGVAEQNMTSMACGLALEGCKVFTYSIGNFSTLRCLEQIRNDVCYHNADVTIVTVGAGFSYGQLEYHTLPQKILEFLDLSLISLFYLLVILGKQNYSRSNKFIEKSKVP